jgi:plasmid stabilization system protein ParE
MGHRRTPQADSDLDGIWYHVAFKSGSIEMADRLIDSITDRFSSLASHPNIGRARNEDLRSGLRPADYKDHPGGLRGRRRLRACPTHSTAIMTPAGL